MKKINSIIIILVASLLVFVTCNIIVGGDDDGRQHETNPGGRDKSNEDVAAFGGGTRWIIKSNGNEVIIDLDAGQTVPGGGGIQGYDPVPGGAYSTTNTVVNATASNMIAALEWRANNTSDPAEAARCRQMIDDIKKGDYYCATSESYTYVRTSLSEKYTYYGNPNNRYTYEELMALARDNPDLDIENELKSMLEWLLTSWSDDEKGIKGKGFYENETPTKVITTKVTDKPTPNPSLTKVKAPSKTPTPIPTTSKTPTPTPSPTPTQDPVLEWALVPGSYKNCYGQNINTTLEIDNSLFGVAEGNPIPTSEKLTISGTTNWLANLTGIRGWILKVVNAQNIKYRVKYVSAVKEWTYKQEYKIEDGVKKKSGDAELQGEPKIIASTVEEIHEYMNGNNGNSKVKDSEGNDIIKLYTFVPEYTPERDITEEIKRSTIPYNVTAEATLHLDSSAGVGNEVFANGMIEKDIPEATGIEIIRGANGLPRLCYGMGDDKSRVSKKFNFSLDPFERDAECCQACAIAMWSGEQTIGQFYSVKSDGNVEVKYNGKVNMTGCNKDYTVETFGETALRAFTIGTEIIGYWKENRSAGKEYETTWAYHDRAGVRYWIEDDDGVYGVVKDGNVNDVRVHTPIHNELGIVDKYPNQLENGQMTPSNITVTQSGIPVFGEGDSKITGGNADLGLLPTSSSAKEKNYEIVTMGDEFEVELKAFGDGTAYYDNISGFPKHMLKYIKYAELHCGICNKTFIVTDLIRVYGNYKHNCRAYVDRVDDLRTYNITSKIIAENEGELPTVNYETDEAQNNVPDSIYTLTQNKGILIVGKIYDMQIRTVNDPDWKIKAAEKLSKLPTGEQGDNGNKTIKDGIKLGYRAYFDLKTLGSISNEIEIIPKIYYINKNNGKVEGIIGNDLEMWVKSGNNKTDWDKINPKDIIVKMQMNNTNGSVNNPIFTEEQSRMIKQNLLDLKNPYFENVEKIEYTKNLTIGGLCGLNLSTQNAVATKCTYVYNSSGVIKTDYTSPETKSRRWLGEIYIPATARVIRAGDYNQNKQKVMNDRDTYKDGYLLLTFEVIRTQITNSLNGAEVPYLRYDEVRDSKWRKPGDAGYSAIENKSVLVIEKAGKGETTANPIKLPNGNSVTNLPADFYKTTAPMIIYDVSLRANDDIEDLATH